MTQSRLMFAPVILLVVSRFATAQAQPTLQLSPSHDGKKLEKWSKPNLGPLTA